MSLPPGRWSLLLVGDQWPDDNEMATLRQGQTNRGRIRSGLSNFADLLHSAQIGQLAEQRGLTVTNLRNTFIEGEDHARRVAEKNAVKEGAYNAAYDSMLSLRNDLTSLAAEGNKEIKAIEDSKLPAEAKIGQIVTLINHYRAIANIAAAKYGGNVVDAMQRILDTDGMGRTARQFAQAHGADVGQMYRQSRDHTELTDQVRGMMSSTDSRQVLKVGELPTGTQPTPGATLTPESRHGEPQLSGTGCLPTVMQPANGVGLAPKQAPSAQQVSSVGRLPPGPAQRAPSLPAALPSRASTPSALGIPANPSSSVPTPFPSAFGGRSTPLSEASIAAPVPTTPTITPAELAQNFNKGFESSAPISAATHAVQSAPMTPTEPQTSHAQATIPASVPSSQVHVPVTDSPPPAHHAAALDTPAAPAIVAAAPAVSPAITPQSVGALPTYGSDFRPSVMTTVTPPAPPSAPPMPATPGSAPVTPSAGQPSTNQPTVVRQSAASAPPPPPPGIGTQAVAATATGAAAGAASANATTRARLQRLVAVVARQQPRLAWAAGERADNTTVLATDLASGWVPPGVDLPSAVTLLQPARRRGKLEALLGEVTVAANYTPIHHIQTDNEPPPTSPRPRFAPEVGDLGWELSQATQWRDGLPRLAHTLAKAASASTGVLDSEVELMREHLATISARVLDSYPDHVDTHDVGNWQLLAAIDALVADDKKAANYHLAWFLACKASAAKAGR